MITTKFKATLTDKQTKTSSKGTEFMVARFTYEGEAYGRPITTVVEATVPSSQKDTFPDVGSEGEVTMVVSSREFNGRLYYDFRVNEFEPTKVVIAEDQTADANKDILSDIGDEVPF